MPTSQNKKVSRTREDIRREQQAHRERTQQEMDAIVADFHAQLPREKAQSLGAVYARYSTSFQDSLADQVRSLFEAAVRQRIFIPAENVFFDAAVRGGKEPQTGLNALKAATEDKQYQVLLVFSTSRLYRKAYKAMRFVSEEIVERGFATIFVSSNLDTADAERWQLMLQMYANFDEAANAQCTRTTFAPRISVFSSRYGLRFTSTGFHWRRCSRRVHQSAAAAPQNGDRPGNGPVDRANLSLVCGRRQEPGWDRERPECRSGGTPAGQIGHRDVDAQARPGSSHESRLSWLLDLWRHGGEVVE